MSIFLFSESVLTRIGDSQSLANFLDEDVVNLWMAGDSHFLGVFAVDIYAMSSAFTVEGAVIPGKETYQERAFHARATFL